jgi:hypothetical protein
MRENGRTPPPSGGLAPLGAFPKEENEDYGAQEFGATRKENSAAGEGIA